MDAAFLLLRERARSSQEKLSEVARRVVNDVTVGRPTGRQVNEQARRLMEQQWARNDQALSEQRKESSDDATEG
jgi:hypothetical protein